jgi:hypothetical protein
MRTLKTLLLAIAITTSSVLSAATDKNPKSTTPTKELKASNPMAKEVMHHLKKPRFTLEEDVLVYVKFALNDENEIVVLSVDSEDWEIDNYIKKRLNYKKIKAESKSGLKKFIIPVRINASN